MLNLLRVLSNRDLIDHPTCSTRQVSGQNGPPRKAFLGGPAAVRLFGDQVCIASRGKVKKLCMEVKAGTSADVSIRALRGSGGL